MHLVGKTCLYISNTMFQNE